MTTTRPSLFTKTERLWVAPERDVVHVRLESKTIVASDMHPLLSHHARQLLQSYPNIRSVSSQFGNVASNQYPNVPFLEEPNIETGPSGLMVTVEFFAGEDTATTNLNLEPTFYALLRELSGTRRLVAAPLGTSVQNQRLHRIVFTNDTANTISIVLPLEGPHSMMGAEYLHDFFRSNNNGIFLTSGVSPRQWSNWLLDASTIASSIPQARQSMTSGSFQNAARPILGRQRRSLGFEWTRRNCDSDDENHCQTIETLQYMGYSVQRQRDDKMTVADLLPPDTVLAIDPLADETILELVNPNHTLSCMANGQSKLDLSELLRQKLSSTALQECLIPPSTAVTVPVLFLSTHLFRRQAHRGTFQIAVENVGETACQVQLKQTLSRVIQPVWSSMEIVVQNLAASERFFVPWQNSNLVSFRSDGGYDLALDYPDLPPQSTMRVSFHYQPVFLSIEEFPGDPNRGFELAPARARIQCSDPPYFTTLYSNAVLFHAPLPDMSMPFNVMSMTCTLYAFVIGGLINLLIKRANKQVKDALDPENAEPDGLLWKVIWKIKQRVQKFRSDRALKRQNQQDKNEKKDKEPEEGESSNSPRR